MICLKSFWICILKNLIYSRSLLEIITLKSKSILPQKNPQPNKLTCETTNSENEICLISPLKQWIQLWNLCHQKPFYLIYSEPFLKFFPQGISRSLRSSIVSKCSPDITHLLGVSVDLFSTFIKQFLLYCRL